MSVYDDLIAEGEEIISQSCSDKADAYIRKCINTCNGRITKKGLNKYRQRISVGDYTSYVYSPTDKLDDVKTVITRLRMIKEEQEIMVAQAFQTQQPVFNNYNNVNITVTISNTISAIQALPEKELSANEKLELIEKLNEIDAIKGKDSKWEKAKGLMKWLADKTVNVFIAAMPYILQQLSM